MTAAFFLCQHIDFRLELLEALHTLGSRKDLTSFDLVLFDTAEQDTNVVAGNTLIQSLLELFDTSDD